MENTILSATPSSAIFNNFTEPEYRHALVDAYIREGIAFQLRALRADATQGKIAYKLGSEKLQSLISRYENPDYGRYSLATLTKLARLFDVALVVRFEPFSEFISWHRQSQFQSIAIPSFDAELKSGAIHKSTTAKADEYSHADLNTKNVLIEPASPIGQTFWISKDSGLGSQNLKKLPLRVVARQEEREYRDGGGSSQQATA